MYLHPDVQHAELGLGGWPDHLVVWLFGRKWKSPPITLGLSQWYSLCLTWSHTKDKPSLYIDGKLVDMTLGGFSLVSTFCFRFCASYYCSLSSSASAHPSDTCPSSSPSCHKLAPNGTLTLGVSHRLNNGIIQIIPMTGMVGKVSLFRLWQRERSKQEVTSVNCTDGDVLKWERDNWDTREGTELSNSNLQCGENHAECPLRSGSQTLFKLALPQKPFPVLFF